MSITKLGTRVLQATIDRFRARRCVRGGDMLRQKRSNRLARGPARARNPRDGLLVVVVSLVAALVARTVAVFYVPLLPRHVGWGRACF